MAHLSLPEVPEIDLEILTLTPPGGETAQSIKVKLGPMVEGTRDHRWLKNTDFL